MKHFSGIFFLFLLFFNLSGQNRQSVELNADYGFIFLHAPSVEPIGKSNPYGISADYSYWLLKKKHWKTCHCFPRTGVSFNYHNFNNVDVLGFSLPLYGFIESWFRIFPNVFYTIRGGVGYSWSSQPYHPETNPKNRSYSKHFNPFGMLGTGVALKLSDHWRVAMQARYNHLSNGGHKEPNSGLNYPSANLSLSYSMDALPFREREKVPLEDLDLQKSLAASGFVARQAIDASGKAYPVAGAAIKYSRQFGRTSAWVIGSEYINNMAYKQRIAQEGLDQHHHQLTLMAGHEFLLGQFTFSQLIGVYIIRDYDTRPVVYQRYGLEWYFWKGFSVGTAIKTHAAVAEFLDFRIGYRHQL